MKYCLWRGAVCQLSYLHCILIPLERAWFALHLHLSDVEFIILHACMPRQSIYIHERRGGPSRLLAVMQSSDLREGSQHYIHCIQYSCTFLISKFDVRLLARFALASFRNSMHTGQSISLSVYSVTLLSCTRIQEHTARALHACMHWSRLPQRIARRGKRITQLVCKGYKGGGRLPSM